MLKNALIIFAKNPVIGKVKTRIAKAAGNEMAFEVYNSLLKNIYLKTRDLDLNKFLFLSDNPDNKLFDPGFTQVVQKGKDIGTKMHNAIEYVLEKGNEKAILVGADVPGVNDYIIIEAFEKLTEFDIVLGPAKDGGYYLIGMKKPDASLFEEMNWSNDKVLSNTIERIEIAGKSFCLVKELRDVDTAEDLNSEFLAI